MSYEMYGFIQQFDDGHIPETTPEKPTRIILYSKARSENACAGAGSNPSTRADNVDPAGGQKPTIQIYSGALPVSLCHDLYNETVERNIPWGTYVTKEEATGRLNDPAQKFDVSKTTTKSVQELATQAVSHFVFGNIAPDRIINGDCLPSLVTNPHIHGVQVWALASQNGSCVPYHIDYAEYIRYTENIIVTPVLAGTIQCTPSSSHGDMEGGIFAVNTGGLGHYRKFGYKGQLMEKLKGGQQKMGGWKEPNQPDKIALDLSSGWVSIPYKFNQGIMHTGNLPHLSSRVRGLIAGRKRVIVGFNVFYHDVGQKVRQTPEHSDQFRRLVKFHRTVAKLGSQQSKERKATEENKPGREDTKDCSIGCIQIESAKKNKALTKILVLAKREKVKRQWQDTRMFMTKWVHDQLSTAGNSGLKVGELIERWGADCRRPETADAIDILPSKDDILVHINHLLHEKDSKIKVVSCDICSHILASDFTTQSVSNVV